MNYAAFLNQKFSGFSHYGPDTVAPLSGRQLFPFQRAVVEKMASLGRGAAFLDTGMGKTRIQLEWARALGERTLIVCPLAVADQTLREAETLDIDAGRIGEGRMIDVVNYDRLGSSAYDPSRYRAVVYDESSIMKGLNSQTRAVAISQMGHTRYRLACSATPAPNDYMELGQQSEALGVMRHVDMLSRFFVNDSSNTGEWRIKGHARAEFWRWVGSWAVVASSPTDLGDDETDLSLPPLEEEESIVPGSIGRGDGDLFGAIDLSATGIRASKRASIQSRVERCADLCAGDDYAIVWCETNDESAALVAAIPDAIEVRGDTPDKEPRLVAFSRGDERVLVTKPSIAGFGLNWQHCNNVVFAGATYSFERYYQAVRRCWRFGQTRPVLSRVVMTEQERLIWLRVREKAAAHESMSQEVARYAR